MKILVIQQKMIGDVLTTALLFEALKRKYPKSELHYVINSNTEAVIRHNPFIDKLLMYTPEIQSQKSDFYKFLKVIRSENYDVVIDAYSKLSSNLMSFYSRAKMRISKRKWYTSWIYTHPIHYKSERRTSAGLAIENRFQLLEPLSIALAPNDKPKIYLTADETNDSGKFLSDNKIDLKMPLFMIAVLGSGSSKTYPSKYMAEVLNTLASESKGQILFNYIPKQEQEAREIFDLCSAETQKQIFFDVYGRDLRSFLAIVHHCDALIGNEGGAINMAKALNIPTFTIFSPWIDKATWSIFENEHNVSVHLKDFQPDFYANMHESNMKSRTDEAYQMFKPQLFENQLKSFLNHLSLQEHA
ncbi:MAG: glycosyltransferase family 9 protein [Flavobacteriaceae bacterium]|nr:glycosyltransferase family 9 protein [Flavobacteriaceae bacterium]